MTTREQIIASASDAGLQLIWDGKFGREDYHSIMGSFPSLERFYTTAFDAGQKSLRQQLASSQKREVMLREKLNTLVRTYPECAGKDDYEALAATDNLERLRLCHAEPTVETLSVVTNTGYVYVRAIDRKVEPNTKLFSAWEPKP